MKGAIGKTILGSTACWAQAY